MLLNLKIIIFILIIFFAGCVQKKGFNQNNIPYNSKHSVKDSKAMHKATMRPYVIKGKKYYPKIVRVNDELFGIASWYGPDFHSKKTSNGEIYDMYAMTAAHKTLPMNTIVKVENLENNKDVIVRINDRGPFITGRIIDLSNSAAHQVDMVKKGTAKIKLTILGFHSQIANTSKQKKISITPSHFILQVGAFSKYSGALQTKTKFEILSDIYKIEIKKFQINRKNIYKVWITGFKSEEEAINFKEENGLKFAVILSK